MSGFPQGDLCRQFCRQLVIGCLVLAFAMPVAAQNCRFLPGADQTDTDADGLGDLCDNCVEDANSDQLDTDADGYGNLCDADFNQNEVVDPFDFSLLKSRFGGSTFPDQDLNGNGIVDPFDFSQLKAHFGLQAGPTGLIFKASNTRPVADAGPDQTAAVFETVQLDGSGSMDADTDPLQYSWAIVSKPFGSIATLSDPYIVNPTILYDIAGTFVIELAVTDGTIVSEIDTMEITLDPNPLSLETQVEEPQGTSGMSQLQVTGQSGSSGGTAARSQTLAPPAPATQTTQSSEPPVASQTYGGVSVASDPQPPVADIVAPPVGFTGYALNLDGSGSSTDSGSLVFQWAIVDQPATSQTRLADADLATAALTPDVAGRYVVQLLVTNETLMSASATQTIDVEALDPWADADGDGLSNQEEGGLGTDIHDADADGDGSLDGDEWLNPVAPAASTADAD